MARQPRERDRRRLDPRLAIGVVLIAASTAGVWALVTGLDETTEVYAVRDTVTAGDRIGAADLSPTSVQLGEALDRYVTRERLPADGALVTRTIRAGELLPRSAVTDPSAAGLATVVVAIRGALPGGLGAGSPVDVWSAAPLEGGTFAAPVVLVAGAEIAAVVEPGGLVAPGAGAEVELRVTHDQVGTVLTAIAEGDAIDLVAARPDEEP
jgi:hypothetical protein